jgi:hypothetical protein
MLSFACQYHADLWGRLQSVFARRPDCAFIGSPSRQRLTLAWRAVVARRFGYGHEYSARAARNYMARKRAGIIHIEGN